MRDFILQRPVGRTARARVGRGLILVVLVVTAWLSLARSAGAIVGGQVDGSAHPYAGAIDARQTGGRLTPSGVLISPTVYLTAGHVTRRWDNAGLTRARVTFDPIVSATSTWYTGTVHTDPAYDPKNAADPNDLGVVVFDAPIPGITPASLPTAGLFDEIGPQGLADQIFTVVGYGTTRFEGGGNGGGRPHPDLSSGGTRKNAQETFLSLTPAWLRLGVDEDGQPCVGDSGGPSLLENSSVVAGITVAAAGQCDVPSAPQADMRLDTPAHRAFLGQYVALP